MAGLAHAHPSQHHLAMRAEVAARSYQDTSLTIELFARLGQRIVGLIRRWATAHRQAVQDRLFWELALGDPRVMDDLRAMRDRAEQG
jgi:hypothetical protein